MSADECVPFGFADHEVEQYRVLVDGVPEWMKERLISVLVARMTDEGWAKPEYLLVVQNESRVSLSAYANQGWIKDSELASRLRVLSDGRDAAVGDN